MNLRNYILLVISVGLISANIGNTACASVFQYRDIGCIQAILVQETNRLYVSHHPNNEIVEIDPSNMAELRSFNIDKPGSMTVSPNGLYLYVTSDKSGYNVNICKLRLSDGHIESVQLPGECSGLTINDDGDWLWAIYRTFPEPGFSFPAGTLDEILIEDHPDSSRIAKISTANMSVVSDQSIKILPMDIIYTSYNNRLFILHESITSLEHDSGFMGEYTVSVLDANTLNLLYILDGGFHQSTLGIPSTACEWSNDQRYIAIPSSVPHRSYFSLRVFDVTNGSVEFDLAIPRPNSESILHLKILRKANECNYLWAASEYGEPSGPGRSRMVVRINTVTQEYDTFIIPEATSPIGFFDVSPDGRTLYLTQPRTGKIIVTSPGNHDPVCNLMVITPRPHTGPSPVAIEFDASGTYDDDGDTLTFHWDFDGDKVFDEPIDDAYTGTPENPTHEYTADYEGAVNLRVTDNYQGECDIAVILSVDVE